jgi:adenylate kinase family enzyme
MRRIVVVGCGGSGKTVLARKLGEILKIPVVHLDALFYDEDWQPCPPTEFRARQEAAIKDDSWLMDGNYVSTLPIRLAAADTVIFLDFSAARCLWGVLQRQWRFQSGQRREQGIFVRITWPFIKYVLGYRRRMAPRVRAAIAAHADSSASVVVLRSRRAVRRYCEQIEVSDA